MCQPPAPVASLPQLQATHTPTLPLHPSPVTQTRMTHYVLNSSCKTMGLATFPAAAKTLETGLQVGLAEQLPATPLLLREAGDQAQR